MRKDVIIHKQTFQPYDKLVMEVPIGSTIVDIREDYHQSGNVAIWYERPAASPGTEEINLFVIPTGQVFDVVNNNASFLQTVHMKNGLVWHLYIGRRT